MAEEPGARGLIRTIIKYALFGLMVIVGIALWLPCSISCLQNFIEKTVSKAWHTTLLAQKENGGSVESLVQDCLIEKGRSQTNLIMLREK